MKQAVIRQVKSMFVGCDKVGNILLAKFSFHGGKDAAVFLPYSIVFWLLDNIPVNQDPQLLRPPIGPQLTEADWDLYGTPRAISVQCKQFNDAVRMTFELEQKPDLSVLLDLSNLEMMRRFLEAYRNDLVNLDAE